MGREVFKVDEQAIRQQYAEFSHAQRLLEQERLEHEFADDVRLGHMIEDCAQLEQGAIETRARIRILGQIMENTAEQAGAERVRHNLAAERPNARIALKNKFAGMSRDEKRAELARAQEALDAYDQEDLSSETCSEDPLLRDHRILMEETVNLLSRELSLI